MNWPQITVIVLLALSGGIHLAKHGEQREPFNFITWAVSAAITLGLLWAGGFFG